MKRVRFLTSTNGYGKGAVVSLSDEAAQKAIASGDAVAGEPIQSVGGPQAPGEPMTRVIFLKPFKDGDKQWPKDARAVLPEKVAVAAIKSGAAKAFPITSIDREPAKPIRSGKREPATA